MKRYLRIAALVAVLAVVAAACGGSDEPSGNATTSGQAAPTGGTLSTVMTQDFFHGLDPTAEYYSVSWEFLRCCMARTMLSYNGKPAEEGGGDPQPDLAADMPTVSEDGLTWTFTIKDGVMFGDPLNREITAQDFVNSINRLSDPKINDRIRLFWFATGKDDFVLPSTKAALAMLDQHKIRYSYKETEGGHTWPNWRAYLNEFAPLLFR